MLSKIKKYIALFLIGLVIILPLITPINAEKSKKKESDYGKDYIKMLELVKDPMNQDWANIIVISDSKLTKTQCQNIYYTKYETMAGGYSLYVEISGKNTGLSRVDVINQEIYEKLSEEGKKAFLTDFCTLVNALAYTCDLYEETSDVYKGINLMTKRTLITELRQQRYIEGALLDELMETTLPNYPKPFVMPKAFQNPLGYVFGGIAALLAIIGLYLIILDVFYIYLEEVQIQYGVVKGKKTYVAEGKIDKFVAKLICPVAREIVIAKDADLHMPIAEYLKKRAVVIILVLISLGYLATIFTY